MTAPGEVRGRTTPPDETKEHPITARPRIGLDGETLRRGIEERDLEAILDLYADDAELRLMIKAADLERTVARATLGGPVDQAEAGGPELAVRSSRSRGPSDPVVPLPARADVA